MRIISLEEAKKINPRMNEKLGCMWLSDKGNIIAENPFPNHKVEFTHSANKTKLTIDGKEVEACSEEYWKYWYGEI